MSHQEVLQYREIVQNFEATESRLTALNEFKNVLLFKTPEESVNIIEQIGISKLFHCLNINDRIHVDLVCEVLQICFNKLCMYNIVQKYIANIMFMLRHGNSSVRKLAVEEVHKAVCEKVDSLPLHNFIDLYVAIAQLVIDEDTGIANKAVLITSNLPIEAYPKVLEEMKLALDYSTSSKCNAFEVIINITSKKPELLKLVIVQEYIDYMLKELNCLDIVYQMNILELLSQLALVSHGVDYMVQHGALDKISNMLVELKSNPLASLIIPGYMKFFGCIAHLYPREIFQKYPILIDSLFECLESDNQSLLPIALDTLGFIGMSVEGKCSLLAIGSKYTSTISVIGNFIRTGVTEIKIRALHCMASLIGVTHNGTIDNRITLMTREWFRSLSSQPESIYVLFELCKNPFPDIKLAAFELLDAICQYRWGHELVAKTPGFVEYVLDRLVDYAKEVKEIKYNVIKKLSSSTAFDPSITSRLEKYVSDGPFFRELELQVAMEEGE